MTRSFQWKALADAMYERSVFRMSVPRKSGFEMKISDPRISELVLRGYCLFISVFLGSLDEPSSPCRASFDTKNR